MWWLGEVVKMILDYARALLLRVVAVGWLTAILPCIIPAWSRGRCYQCKLERPAPSQLTVIGSPWQSGASGKKIFGTKHSSQHSLQSCESLHLPTLASIIWHYDTSCPLLSSLHTLYTHLTSLLTIDTPSIQLMNNKSYKRIKRNSSFHFTAKLKSYCCVFYLQFFGVL